jgi:uncharacterized protein with HEPN domain
MQLEVQAHLFDALTACRAIRDFSCGKSYQDYTASLLLRSAIERQFEILGEAFNRCSQAEPELREQCPNMGNIIGMRNRIIHGYDSVDDAIIWDATTIHVPNLLKWLESLGL